MNRKPFLTIALAALIAFVVHACAFAGTEADGAVEESRIYVHGFGPIYCLEYITRYAEGDLVVLGVDAGWLPKQSIAYQKPLEDVNILYVRPPASNDGYAPVSDKRVSESNRNNQILFAQQIVPLLEKKFPSQRVALFGFSRGGWYLDELYKELKAHGREVVLAWCNDACPGDDKDIYGFPELEKDGIPIYVAISSGGGGKIVSRTRKYGESGNPDVVFFRKYGCNHTELSAAAAEELRAALRLYEDGN